MTWEKKSYEIYSGDKILNNDFYSLWKVMAEKFKFYKIKINDNYNQKEFIDSDYIKFIIKNKQQKHIDFKYSNSIVHNNDNKEISIFDILYQNNEYVIVTEKNWNLGSVFLVPDKSQSNRYFIGFTYNDSSTNYNLCGIIIYFDSDGNLIQQNILDRVVCNYDCRNGKILETNTILYNQTLLFYQIHRDTHTLNLFVNLLDYNDNLLVPQTFYDTQMYTNNYDLNNLNNLNYRFFYIKKVNDQLTQLGENTPDRYSHVFIDLCSLKLLKNHKKERYDFEGKLLFKSNPANYLSIDYYTSNYSNNPNGFLEKSYKFEKEEYSDGYITYCVKCNGLTSEGIYNYKNITMGFGNSFCTKCQIRYSQSEKSWVCCKLTKEIDNINKRTDTCCLCFSRLETINNYECDKCHLHSNKYNLKVIKTKTHYKLPFKETINIYPKEN